MERMGRTGTKLAPAMGSSRFEQKFPTVSHKLTSSSCTAPNPRHVTGAKLHQTHA